MSGVEGVLRASAGLAFCTMLLTAVAAGDELAVSLVNLAVRGTFEVVNHGARTELSSQVTVQRREGGAWRGVTSDVRLVAFCGALPPTSSVTIAAGGTLRPPPWNGFSCGGQCVASCRANVRAAPGNYRLAARTCDGMTTIYGPTFRWP
jgi:hypothetical protein